MIILKHLVTESSDADLVQVRASSNHFEGFVVFPLRDFSHLPGFVASAPRYVDCIVCLRSADDPRVLTHCCPDTHFCCV